MYKSLGYVKVMRFRKAVDLLGKAITVYMKDAEKGFAFKVTGCGPDHISGFDGEGMDLKIELAHIDCIVGG